MDWSLVLLLTIDGFVHHAVHTVRAGDCLPDAKLCTAAHCFLQAAGAGAKTAIELIGAGVKVAKEGYDVAAPVIKQVRLLCVAFDAESLIHQHEQMFYGLVHATTSNSFLCLE